MGNNRNFLHIWIVSILLILTFNNYSNPFFLTGGSQATTVIQTVKTETSLYKEIVTNSTFYKESPQNAYIDKVWKKVPGRNGLKVNIDESYKQMKKNNVFNKELLVYEQEKPEISIKDLKAAPIYRGHHEKQTVSLLFYVVAGSEYIPSILNILKDQQIKATFFIEGKWANDHKHFLQMIDEQEHTIGNHGYDHSNMILLSKQAIQTKMEQTNRVIKATIGKEPMWFAPPSGSFNETVIEMASDLGMETILWTVDTKSWESPPVQVLINRIMTEVHPGATILMHPNEAIVQGLPLIIKNLKNDGYVLDTIDQLLSEDR